MVEVVVSDEAIADSKLNAVILQQIADEIALNPHPEPTRPTPNSAKKWQEICRASGSRYSANCKWVDAKIVINLARKIAQQKVRVSRV